MTAPPTYFNEFDKHAAGWLRGLIRERFLPESKVDERSIKEVRPDEVRDYTRCHFFAGIGGWELALNRAGWHTNRPVWTGSCPCQPYSAAGKQLGDEDPRNLWPDLFRLIRQCHPQCIIGEQVEGAIRKGWLDRVCADLEGEGYTVGACVLGAHSVGAPHIRQRLYWVAYAEKQRFAQRVANCRGGIKRVRAEGYGVGSANICGIGVGADPTGGEQCGCGECRTSGRFGKLSDRGHGTISGVADANGRESGNGTVQCCGQYGQQPKGGGISRLGHAPSDGRTEGCNNRNGNDDSQVRVGKSESCGTGLIDPWADYELVPCRDGKARRVEPGVHPLAHGVSGRVVKLRGYGNAICVPTAVAFIKAFLAAESDSIGGAGG